MKPIRDKLENLSFGFRSQNEYIELQKQPTELQGQPNKMFKLKTTENRRKNQ